MTDDLTITAPSEDVVEQDDRPLIDPETGWNRLMVEQIARSIQIAHDLNSKVWSTKTYLELPILNMGKTNFVAGGKNGSARFLVDRDALTPDQMETFEKFRTADEFPSNPSFSIVDLPLQSTAVGLALFADAHTAAIKHTAKSWKINQRWKWHQEEARQQIERVAGITIPQPGYMPELSQLVNQSSGGQSGPIEAGKRYWKISPGPMGKFWNEFRDRAFVAMHWSDTMVDLATFPDDQQEFVAQAKSMLEVSDQGARSLWDFSKVMQPGDEILAYANQKVVGFGTIMGDYRLVDDDFEYMHRRPVTWASVETLPIAPLPVALQARLRTQATLFQLTADQYALATHQTDEQPFTPSFLINSAFAANGLQYTDGQIATFYTALQTKGFVVLSGISGTGKSKIAQGFVDMLPSPGTGTLVDVGPAGFMSVVVKPYMKKSRRLVIPKRYYELLTPMERGQSYTVTVTVDGQQGTGRLWFRIHGGHDQYLLSFHQGLTGRMNDWNLGDSIFLDPVLSADGERVAEFRITNSPPADSIHGTVESSTRATGLNQNHLFLSVRPDWRDSTSLLGYFNPLTQTYEWTDFLRFILRAAESHRAKDGLAWFVILDEMNLAHVEYYFADLLSVIESGRQPGGEDAGFTREPLRTSYPDALDDEMPPHEIFLPPNLYIIGTVNMDETTHAFSPKVLDRAFTIELTDVSFDDYPPTATANAAADLPESNKLALLSAFTRDGRFHGVDKGEVGLAVASHPELRTWLGELNRLLAKDRFHFGYRTFDEIAQYIVSNDLNGMMDFNEAFDQAVFMKVLPKFSGSRARLRNPLVSVLAWAIDPAQPLPKAVVTELDTHLAGTSEALVTRVQGAVIPRVAGRALEMLERVELDGFVSFG